MTPQADRVLVTLPRKGGAEELRVAVRAFNGARFADVRLHFRDRDGSMRPSGKGATIRTHEVAAVLTALELALEELEGRKTVESDPTASW